MVAVQVPLLQRGEHKLMKPSEGSTVIGRSVTIRGDVTGKEDLFMDGVVEGTIALPENRLTVGPNARVLADVEAREVVIFGLVEGNLHATGRIELRESAVVEGDIVAARLSIEENANMRGRVSLSETVTIGVTGRLPGTEDPATDATVLDLT
jgi:cytoskeletal protein CcmA (bactofilin family)